MADTGDWLTPRVNGLPRYDKPPLVYWLMGFGYAWPGREVWDPLGSWAARLPSALATLGLMLGLADTVLHWPFPGRCPAAFDGTDRTTGFCLLAAGARLEPHRGE